MKRIAKAVGKFLLWTLVVVLALLVAEPKLVLNKKTLVWGLTKFGKDYAPKWTALDFHVANKGLRTKRVVFSARDLCFDEVHGALHACFPALDLDATIRLGVSPLASVRRLERLVVHSDAIKTDATKQPKQPPPPEKRESASGSIQVIPAPIRHMTVGLVDVKIPQAEMRTSSGATTVKLDARFSEKGSAPLTVDAYAVLVGTSPNVVSHYKADLSLASDLWRKGRMSYLDLTARLRGDQGLAADATARVRPPKEGELRLEAKATARASGKRLEARVTGDYSKDRASAKGGLAVVDPSGAVRRFSLDDCAFDAPLRDGDPKSADLKCGLAVVPGPFGQPKGAEPKKLAGKLGFHADFKPVRAQRDRFVASVYAEIAPQAHWNDLAARLELSLAGRTTNLPASLTARHKFELGMTIKKFEDLVSYLQDTEFAIPAPVNAFRGTVTLSVRTAGDSKGQDQRIVYKVVSDLKSAKQALEATVTGHVDIKGMFRKKRTISDKTEVDLKNVALELPQISMKSAPRMPSPVVDTRIKTGEPKRDEAVEAKRQSQVAAPPPGGSPVDFDVHVFTSRPVSLISNLNNAPIPISMDLHAAPAGLTGKINIDPVDLQVFRQTGHVDHITLTPKPGTSAMALDGKVVHKRQDATINILLVGSTEKPTVTFESDPPMNQNEIMALLLYGKSPNELDTDQQASAGNASAALTNGALGLTSLYLFASTPIDSVGYDPVTQTYQIRFKLPGGATLSVGSNLQESKTISLRKRVARNLELETQMRQGQQQSQKRDAVTTFLQWFRRY